MEKLPSGDYGVTRGNGNFGVYGGGLNNSRPGEVGGRGGVYIRTR
jgi:hypothetical protein